jgi:hypothetical protein
MLANLRHLTSIPDTIYINTHPSYVTIILKALYPYATIIDAKACPAGIPSLQQSSGPLSREAGVRPEEYVYVRSILEPILAAYQPTQTYSPYIYISRNSDSGKRRLLNEQAMLLPELQRIVLSEVPILDQLYIFYKAKLIVGIHGGGFVHLLHCANRPIIIELASPHMSKLQHFEHIAQTLSLPYTRYIADPIHTNSYDSDLFIKDPDDFKLFIQNQSV